MKTATSSALTFLLALVLFVNGSWAQNNTSVPLAGLEVFLFNFEQAVLNHDEQLVLLFIDREYVYEQHDQFLEGRTKQFLNEFFCGKNLNDDGFICIPFHDIMRLERTDIVENNGEFTVYCNVSSAHAKVHTDWLITVMEVDGKFVFGIYGAVG